MKTEKQYGFSLFNLLSNDSTSELIIGGIEAGERHGALFALSVEPCACNDPFCNGRQIFIDFLWAGLFMQPENN